MSNALRERALHQTRPSLEGVLPYQIPMQQMSENECSCTNAQKAPILLKFENDFNQVNYALRLKRVKGL